MRYRLKLATWTIVREPDQPPLRIPSGHAAIALLACDLPRTADDDKEHFWLILLNAENHYLMPTLISTRTQSASFVHPHEVLGPALREGSASLILVHNRPSGDPTPPPEDVRLTRQAAEGAKLLDVRLHDHVIVGNRRPRRAPMRERVPLAGGRPDRHCAAGGTVMKPRVDFKGINAAAGFRPMPERAYFGQRDHSDRSIVISEIGGL